MEAFPPIFLELIAEFNRFNVRHIIVGGYAVIAHGYQRTTGDLDLWVEPTEANYKNLVEAFFAFGLPIDAIGLQRFLNVEDNDVFRFGRPPIMIDIMTKVKGLVFEEVYERSEITSIENVSVRIIDLISLLSAKRAANRMKDLADIEELVKMKSK